MEKEDIHFMNNAEKENEDCENATQYEDLYTDICNFDLGTEIDKAKEENKVLLDNIHELESTNEKLIEVIGILTVQENNLKTNISSLYLTAKTEIERKDRTITELRTELEDLKFRRVGKRIHDNNFENARPFKLIKIDDIKDSCFGNNAKNMPENGTLKELEVNQIQKSEFNGIIERKNDQERYLENRNPNRIDTDEKRFVTNLERVGRGRSRDRDRSRDRTSKHQRSKSTGRTYMGQNIRYNGNSRFNEKFSRNRDTNCQQEQFQRREDNYYNKYEERFKERYHQSRRELSSSKYRNDPESQSTRDSRVPDYRDKNDRDKNERDTYKRRRFLSREERYHNNDNTNDFDNRKPDKPRIRSKSVGDSRRGKEKRREVLQQIPEDEGLESKPDITEREKRKYSRISYADYKGRVQPELTVIKKEETRKEKSEVEPKESIRMSDFIVVSEVNPQDSIRESDNIVVSQGKPKDSSKKSDVISQDSVRHSDDIALCQVKPQESIRQSDNFVVSRRKPQDSIKQSDNMAVSGVKSQDSVRHSDDIVLSQVKPKDSIRQSDNIVVTRGKPQDSIKQSDNMVVSDVKSQDSVGHSDGIVLSQVKPQNSIRHTVNVVVSRGKPQGSIKQSDNIVVSAVKSQDSVRHSDDIVLSQVKPKDSIRQSDNIVVTRGKPQDSIKQSDNMVVSDVKSQDSVGHSDGIVLSPVKPHDSIRHTVNVVVSRGKPQGSIKQFDNIVVSAVKSQDSVRHSDGMVLCQVKPQSDNILVSRGKPQEVIKKSDNIVSDVKLRDSTRESNNIIVSQESPHKRIRHSRIVISQVKRQDTRQSDLVADLNTQDNSKESDNILVSLVKPLDTIKPTDKIESDVKSKDSMRQSDNIGSNDSENISLNILENQSLSSKDDDSKSLNTSQLTFTSEGSEDQLSHKKPKKKLRAVTKLENKILKTPIKKYPQEKNPEVRNVENPIKVKNRIDKMLSSLFDELDDVIYSRSSQAESKQKGTNHDNASDTRKQVVSNLNKPNEERNSTVLPDDDKVSNKISNTGVVINDKKELKETQTHDKSKSRISKRLVNEGEIKRKTSNTIEESLVSTPMGVTDDKREELKHVPTDNKNSRNSKTDDGEIKNKRSNTVAESYVSSPVVVIGDEKERLQKNQTENKKKSKNDKTLSDGREIRKKISNSAVRSLVSAPGVVIVDEKQELKDVQTEKNKKSRNSKTVLDEGEFKNRISDKVAESLVSPPVVVIGDEKEELQESQTENRKISNTPAECFVSPPVVVIGGEKEDLQNIQTEKEKKKPRNVKTVLDDGEIKKKISNTATQCLVSLPVVVIDDDSAGESLVSMPVTVIDDEKDLKNTQTENNKNKSRSSKTLQKNDEINKKISNSAAQSLVSVPVIDDKKEVKHIETDKNKRKSGRENPVETKVLLENTKKDNLLEMNSSSLQCFENVQNLILNLEKKDARNDAVKNMNISWEINEIEPFGINVFSETTVSNEIDEKLLKKKINDYNTTPECIEKINSEVEDIMDMVGIRNSQGNLEYVKKEKTASPVGKKENRKLVSSKKSPSPIRKSSKEKDIDSIPNGKNCREKNNYKEAIKETKSVELNKSENDINVGREESSNFEPLKRRIRSSSLYARYEHESAEDDDSNEENVVIPNGRRRTKSISEKSARRSSDPPHHVLSELEDLENRIKEIRKNYKIPKLNNLQAIEVTNGPEQDDNSKNKKFKNKRKSGEIEEKPSPGNRKSIRDVIEVAGNSRKTIVQKDAKKAITEKKSVDKIENIKSGITNKTSRSTSRKRKNSESNKKVENKVTPHGTHSKKAKIESEHKNERVEDSELNKKKEKRHYTVPSNTTQLSTPHAIRDILKGTFTEPNSIEEKIKKENSKPREIMDSQHAVENTLKVEIDHPDTQNGTINEPPNKKIVILSDVIVSPVISRKNTPQGSYQNNVVSTDEIDMKTNVAEVAVVLEMAVVTENNSKENLIKNKKKENLDDKSEIMDISNKEESSNSTVMSPIESSTGKKKSKAKKKTTEPQELRRSKRNVKTEPPAINEVVHCSKDESKDCPVETNPAQICSFDDILEKNNTVSFPKSLTVENSLHLTHDGEIPVLTLDENHFRNLPNEIILSKNPDKNIMKLLDNMNISNMECDIQDTEEHVKIKENVETKSVVESLNESLTFENLLCKASSTPFNTKASPGEKLSDNNNIKNNDLESMGKTLLFTPENNENPAESENVSLPTNFVTVTAQITKGNVAPVAVYDNLEILKNEKISGGNGNGSDNKSEKHLSDASCNLQETKSGGIERCNISSECKDGEHRNISDINNTANKSDTLVRTVSFPRRRRCRIVRIA